MRSVSKVAVAFTLALGLGSALAKAQPLIAGNTAAFGCGPIMTSDFTLGMVQEQFFPDGAGGADCNTGPVNNHNGRGVAIGGLEVFYTELDEIAGPTAGFGPTQYIRVATFNAGVGSPDVRLLPNPRPGSGIQDLTFAKGILYALTGYDTQEPIVYGLNLLTGAVVRGPITIHQPTGTSFSLDGFAVLENGNFLANYSGTSCIYSQYNPITGVMVPGTLLNVPGGPARCTGVDTDGTSLYFVTDFTGITRTDLDGNLTGYNNFNNGEETFTMDISLVHPVTIIVDSGPANLYFTLTQTDDINTNFDIYTELLLNGSVIGTGLKRCVRSDGPPGTFIPRNIPGLGVGVPTTLASNPLLISGDVLSFKVYARIGTNLDGTIGGPTCGGHSTATGLRFLYDSPGSPSQFSLEIAPNPSQTLYLRSDGTTCNNAQFDSQVDALLIRSLNSVAPTSAAPHCKRVTTLDGRTTNPFELFSTWFLPPLP